MSIPPPGPPRRSLSQPALLLLGATLGLLLALVGPLPPHLQHPAWLALLGSGLGLGALPLGRRRRLSVLLSGLLLGFCTTVPLRPHPPPPLLAPAASSRPLSAVGVMRSLRPLGDSRLAELHLEALEGRPERRVLSVLLPPSAPPLRSGDRVAVHLLLRPWPRPLNPGGRDPGKALLARGLAGRARILDLVRLSTARPSLAGRLRAVLLQPLREGRERVRATLGPLELQSDTQGLLAALSLGDGSGLPPSTRRAFARAGLAHLLAISGLHLGLLVLGAFGLLHRLLILLLASGRLPGPGFLREHPAGVAAALSGLATGFLVSWMDHPASGMRAGLMVLPLFGAVALRRRPAPARALLAAFLCLLLWDPTLWSRVGFQLSCAAAAGLVLGMRRGEELFLLERPWLRSARDLLEATFWATLTTAPLVIHHFGRLPGTGLAANLLAIPLTGLLLTALAPAVLATALLETAALPLFLPATGLARGLLLLARQAAALPGASVLMAPRELWQVIAFGLMILPALLPGLGYLPGLQRGFRRHGIALLALGLLLWPTDRAHPPTAPLEVTFLAVGHGDSVLVRTARGDLLIDGGGDHGERRSVGERVVVPALRALGVRQLEAVFLTHPHPDHLGGLPAVLEAFPVGAIYSSGEGLDPFPGQTAPLARLAGLARRQQIPLRLACREPLPELGPVRVECLWPWGPDPEGPWDPLATANDNSLVLRITLGEVSFLLPGDLEAPGEAGLLARTKNQRSLRSTVLKAPHHGSSTSSTEAFVAAVAPERVVYSVGRESRFDFPRPGVVARWEAAGAIAHRTDLEGTITFRTEGRSLQVQSFLRSGDARSEADDGSRAPPAGRRPTPPDSSARGARGGRD